MVTRPKTRHALALALAIVLGAVTAASARADTETAGGNHPAGLICAQDGSGLTAECDSHLLPWASPQSPTMVPEGWRGGTQLRSTSSTTRDAHLAPTGHDLQSLSHPPVGDVFCNTGPWFPASLVASGKANLPPPLSWS